MLIALNGYPVKEPIVLPHYSLLIMKSNGMAASMDVNLQMDQYHGHHPHNNNLAPHPSSGNLPHSSQHNVLPGQYDVASSLGSFGIVGSSQGAHNPQAPYLGPSSSMQQIERHMYMQQQQVLLNNAQQQQHTHFAPQAVSLDNSTEAVSKSFQNQMPATTMLHHQLNSTASQSAMPMGMQYSSEGRQSSHQPSSPSSQQQYNHHQKQLQQHPHSVHQSHAGAITGSLQKQQQQSMYLPYGVGDNSLYQHHQAHNASFQPPNPQTSSLSSQQISAPQAAGAIATDQHPSIIFSHEANSNTIPSVTTVNVPPNVPTSSTTTAAANYQPPQLPTTSAPAPPGRKRRGRPPIHHAGTSAAVGAGIGLSEEEEHTLYGSIRTGRISPQTLVDDWIEQYKTNREPAMLELIQFLISCSGCKGKVTPEMYSQLGHADIIRKMTEEFDEDSGEYPLIQSSPTWRRFRTSFVEFIQVLVRQCQYSIIYDQCMIDQIISLLTGLSDSQVRAFRHTSTLASMKLMTALVDVALNVSISRDNTQRQYEAERSKLSNRRASDRLEMLMQRRQELEENMEEVKNMLIYLFKGVFVHRYRDNQAEIRSICMQEIGVWMRRYPAMFLDDSYLKYVGWTLFDRVGDVRVQCLRALQPLYEDSALISSLELFTSRFKSRLVDMTLDRETDVAVRAVKLISCILKHTSSVLEDKDCENIYELVYCTHRPLAQAAGEFLCLKLFEVKSQALLTKTKKGKRRSANTPLIRDLVQFFIESELHEHAAYLVDSLWDLSPMLRDWEAMLDLLLEEPGRGEVAMDVNQETSLIEIMVCCVRQAATGEPPVGRQSGAHHSANVTAAIGAVGSLLTTAGGGGRGAAASAREARALAEERQRMTEAMITALPALLSKYGESPERAANLLIIPRFMEMELYTTGRHERHLDLLLQAIQDLVERHTDHNTLLACSRAYEALCVEELSIATKCQTVRGTLLDRLTELYRLAFLNYFDDQGEQPDQDDEFRLHSALKRIYAFYTCHDLSSLDLWDSLIKIVQSPGTSPDIMAQAVTCCCQAILWFVHRVSDVNTDKTDLSKLHDMIHAYMDTCVGYLGHASRRLSCESFVSICDLLVVLSRNIIAHLPHLQPLVYSADREIEVKLTDFLERRVFVDDEDVNAEGDEYDNSKFEALHERRTQLAAFCKLIVYNLVPIRGAAPVYKHYIRCFNDFGDIMKSTLAKSREINRVHTARMLAHSLQLCYQEVEAVSNGNHAVHGSEGLQVVKELSRRLNLSFGLDLIKIREAIIAFHSEGIQYCVASAAAISATTGQPPGVPPNLAFLEVVSEFSNKLLRQDKKGLSEYVSRVFPNPIGEKWVSLNVYRTSLDPDLAEMGQQALTAGQQQQAVPTATPNTTRGMAAPAAGSLPSTSGHHRTGGGGRGRGKRQNRDSDLTSLGESSLLQPQLTSTVIKRRRTAGSSAATKGIASTQPRPGPNPASVGGTSAGQANDATVSDRHQFTVPPPPPPHQSHHQNVGGSHSVR